ETRDNIQLLAAFKLLQAAAESRDQTTIHANNIRLLDAFKLVQAAAETRDQTTIHANNIQLLAVFKLLQAAADRRDQTTVHAVISYYVGSTKHNREARIQHYNATRNQQQKQESKLQAVETTLSCY
ncbi:hypothetical protein EJD97_024107, partial [Solanum chilense]